MQRVNIENLSTLYNASRKKWINFVTLEFYDILTGSSLLLIFDKSMRAFNSWFFFSRVSIAYSSGLTLYCKNIDINIIKDYKNSYIKCIIGYSVDFCFKTRGDKTKENIEDTLHVFQWLEVDTLFFHIMCHMIL